MALHDSGVRSDIVKVRGEKMSIDKFFNPDGTLNWGLLKNRKSDEWEGLQ
jgi:hypothetical protein